MAVGPPDGDGPIPDVAVVSAEAWDLPREIPAELAHTVMVVKLDPATLLRRG